MLSLARLNRETFAGCSKMRLRSRQMNGYPRAMTDIRSATPSDIPALCALMRQYYAHDQLEFIESRATNALHTLLNEARGMAWLLSVDSVDIGYAVIVWSYSLEYGGIEAVLDELYLSPEARGSGLGRALMRHVAQAARTAGGAVVLRLETEHDNENARAFYAQLGFEPLDRVLLMQMH
jgi:ribosomal protein S18 acetylase RimI-like enzyme